MGLLPFRRKQPAAFRLPLNPDNTAKFMQQNFNAQYCATPFLCYSYSN